ncbi:MAG: sporulation initiation factor Spo0A C-terminal domain-containing protein [Oscillospiraceae bacterium]
MNGGLRLLIADANEDFRIMVTNAAKNEEGITYVQAVADGTEAIRLTRELKPDVLLLDIILPKKDGLSVLEALHSMPEKPAIVVDSGFMSHALANRCAELGAAIIVAKPCEMDTLLCRVKFAYETKNTQYTQVATEPDIKVRLTETMQRVGFAAHYKGYYYLREAVLITLKGDYANSGITKVIYPEVAKKFATTPSRVERAIRTMIDKMWERGGAISIRRAMGVVVTGKRLTNSEMIAILTEYMRLIIKIQHTG